MRAPSKWRSGAFGARLLWALLVLWGAGLVLLVCAGSILAAERGRKSAALGKQPQTPRFQLVFLRQGFWQLQLGYDWEGAWPRLQAAADQALLTVDERDVAAFDWQAQRIVLRPEVGLRLLRAAQRLPEPSERLRKLRALWSTGDLQEILRYHGFLVTLDGKPLYGGIVLGMESQMGIDYPVMQVAMDGARRIVLRPSPIQFSFGSLWDDGSGAVLEEAELHPTVRELRAVFPDAKESMGAAGRQEITRFKRLILDPRIRALFAARGTPARPAALEPAGADQTTPAAPARSVRVGATLYFRQDEATLFFSAPDSVAEVRYRIAEPDGDSGWATAGPHGEGARGGFGPGRFRLEVEARDFAGERVGRYSTWLDPEQERILGARDTLDSTANSWFEFDDNRDWDESCLFFSHLQSYQEGLREARYSLDSCNLDRRVPLVLPELRAGESEEHRLFEWVPKQTSYACVQLVYRDGVITAPRRFYHHPEQLARGEVPPEPAGTVAAPSGPISLQTSLSNSGWTLYFETPEAFSAREIRYRIASDAEWRTTGTDNHIDLLSGERLPRTWIVLPPEEVRLGRIRIEVKATGWGGQELGPFSVWFDPERERPDRGSATSPPEP